jgi:hypothetical protein
MTVPPEDQADAWPYTPEQLATIATLLRRPVDDSLVGFVVGIAGDFRKQQAAGGIRASSKRQKDEADAANRAAKALEVLIRLAASRKIQLEMFSIKLSGMFMFGELAFIEKRLREFADNRTTEGSSSAGRKPETDHVVAAIAQLIWAWDRTNPGLRGREKFLDATLKPLGYDISKSVFKHHLKKALSLVRH